MEYHELKLSNCSDSKLLYRKLTRIRGSISVTDLGTSVYVHGEMTQTEFDAVVKTCLQFGDIED